MLHWNRPPVQPDGGTSPIVSPASRSTTNTSFEPRTSISPAPSPGSPGAMSTDPSSANSSSSGTATSSNAYGPTAAPFPYTTTRTVSGAANSTRPRSSHASASRRMPPAESTSRQDSAGSPHSAVPSRYAVVPASTANENTSRDPGDSMTPAPPPGSPSPTTSSSSTLNSPSGETSDTVNA